jgi:hypothetical protein
MKIKFVVDGIYKIREVPDGTDQSVIEDMYDEFLNEVLYLLPDGYGLDGDDGWYEI